ncbi:glycerol-3-phosphate acyltransferase 3-like [Poeciliopsis prolifica]|uniref:glycerol-3-phosphate acyltransferase 3-like n=1 Tax=Poeciliopsis prolifica TaxID=188132 RepID=UPI00241337F2|nr:glycerol-3-phosphate acyltransferase 3-like [Poeciliopsis prolifica]XP_054895477.1 glycerol-3-phosphate acyltransferase 3-like [Poeciliopsis prolifica]XP_054895478.1 glycerol-3-phosphate acyltransferase 3-like [Poeciliopsis prolifica]XP_054895479.1 glycerol-3-phosphate acyltransferase 3-like [Poeciliopsis prolifica]
MENFWAGVLWATDIWLYLIVCLIMIPAMFGFSLGISETYMTILVKTLEWATLNIQKANAEEESAKASASNGLIQREHGSMEKELGELRRSRPKPPVGGDFTLSDCFYFTRRGIESIVDDEVTQRFTSEELVSWNLLTRTHNDFQYISLKLTLVYGLGILVRYCILAPLRITLACIGLTWLVIGTSAVGFLPNCRVKFWLSEWVHVMCYRICARGLSATIHYHNKENRPKKGGICVANHTSPIDIVILCNDGCYAMVGQVHGGLMGIVQRAMVRSCPHVWFERSEMKDRHLVTKRLTDHVNDKTKLPILIFPEGTCVNNTSVMMFKKGSFEIGATIYPVAIKYDPKFGDAFWNSSKYSMVSYLLRMMTSWALVCNVWYLPAMHQQEGEDAVHFANRVKSAIAHQGGLVDLQWDGGLKRAKVKDTFKEQQQKKYSSMVVGDDSSSNSD